MTLHESKHSNFTDLGRLHQRFVGESTQQGAGAQADSPQMIPPATTPPVPITPRSRQRMSLGAQRSLYKHADLGSFPADGDCFSRLAELAEPESWTGPASFGHDATWALREYVERTFERLYQQRGVPTSPDGGHSVFNVGLGTAQHECIYGLFVPNTDPDGAPWQFSAWVPGDDRRLLDHFSEPPPLAGYTNDPCDLIYDWRRELIVTAKQLLESKDSLAVLPDPLRNNPYQAGLVLEGAVRRAEAKVRRCHRFAVPCWDPVQERVHLLLPLSLTTAESVDVALVVAREGESYRGNTLLGLDVAYARARQIARPEKWLTGD